MVIWKKIPIIEECQLHTYNESTYLKLPLKLWPPDGNKERRYKNVLLMKHCQLDTDDYEQLT
jgi:hypothetical protein